MIKIKRENLTNFYKALKEKMPLYIPQNIAGMVNYAPFEENSVVDIDTLKTVKSPKDVFFPQSENMMKFRLEGKTISIEDIRKEREPFLVFGVRACDLKAFEVLDHVFLQEPVDTYYKERREKGVIFTLACGKPEESCFCNVFGIDASAPQGDATCYLDDNYLYVRPNTDKGKAVLSGIDGETCDEKEVSPIVEKTKATIEKLPFSHLDLSYFKPENLNEIFELPDWQQLSQACIGCGTCTFVCPTCQCFDIRDFKTQDGVIRFRCWDSCMYSDFTQMAAANPRTTQMQRFRQRFMHKLVYFPSQYGMYSCVGCGRCVNKCPQHLNIVKVIKKIGGKKNG